MPTTFSKSNYPLEEFNVRAQKKPSKDNQNNNQNDQTVKAIEPRKKQPKKKMSCPHCPILDRNVDANMLRLHIFTHYKEFWEGKVRITKTVWGYLGSYFWGHLMPLEIHSTQCGSQLTNPWEIDGH